VAGLVANPDFSTGEDVTAVAVLGVDFNGWHAVAGIALWAPAFIAARRTDWALIYSLAVIVVGLLPAPVMLIDQEPLGLMAFPNTATDIAYHVIGAGILAAVVAVHFALVAKKSESEQIGMLA
jgi:hypothetical protein